MWIETEKSGAINMDHAGHMRRATDGSWSVFAPDGRHMGDVAEGMHLSDMLNPIVPATQGQEVALVYIWPQQDGTVDVSVERRAVVAWRVSSYDAEPVYSGTREGDDPNVKVLLLHPDGCADELYNRSWRTLNDAVTDLRADALKRIAKKSAS